MATPIHVGNTETETGHMATPIHVGNTETETGHMATPIHVGNTETETGHMATPIYMWVTLRQVSHSSDRSYSNAVHPGDTTSGQHCTLQSLGRQLHCADLNVHVR